MWWVRIQDSGDEIDQISTSPQFGIKMVERTVDQRCGNRGNALTHNIGKSETLHGLENFGFWNRKQTLLTWNQHLTIRAGLEEGVTK